jgi:hypothetical protein
VKGKDNVIEKPGHETNTDDALTPEELAVEQAADLPDREAMSMFGRFTDGAENFAMPINEATAANVYSESSVAIADADQIVILDQVIDQGTDE